MGPPLYEPAHAQAFLLLNMLHGTNTPMWGYGDQFGHLLNLLSPASPAVVRFSLTSPHQSLKPVESSKFPRS